MVLLRPAQLSGFEALAISWEAAATAFATTVWVRILQSFCSFFAFTNVFLNVFLFEPYP